jgi:hypothetical protein
MARFWAQEEERVMTQRIATSLFVALLAAVSLVVPVSAAPAEQRCPAGAVTQFDMAGTYSSGYINVVIYGCGDITVEWFNDYGWHSASYTTVEYVPANGVIARLDAGNQWKLDNGTVIGVKAAERGYVQLYTMSRIDQQQRIYRLRKLS